MTNAVLAPGEDEISPLLLHLSPIHRRDSALDDRDATIHFLEEVVVYEDDQVEDQVVQAGILLAVARPRGPATKVRLQGFPRSVAFRKYWCRFQEILMRIVLQPFATRP